MDAYRSTVMSPESSVLPPIHYTNNTKRHPRDFRVSARKIIDLSFKPHERALANYSAGPKLGLAEKVENGLVARQ